MSPRREKLPRSWKPLASSHSAGQWWRWDLKSVICDPRPVLCFLITPACSRMVRKQGQGPCYSETKILLIKLKESQWRPPKRHVGAWETNHWPPLQANTPLIFDHFIGAGLRRKVLKCLFENNIYCSERQPICIPQLCKNPSMQTYSIELATDMYSSQLLKPPGVSCSKVVALLF